MAGARSAVDPAVRRRPQLEGLQVRVAQQTFEFGRYFVRKVHNRADPLGIQERHAADHGRAGPHMAAAYGAREDQDVGDVLVISHGSIILMLRNHPKHTYLSHS
jgi:hypothetical protein